MFGLVPGSGAPGRRPRSVTLPGEGGVTMGSIIRHGARGITAAALAAALIGSLALWTTEAGGATALPTAYVTNSRLTSLSVFSGATFAGTISKVGRGPTGI